jgi:hypothetical protein
MRFGAPRVGGVLLGLLLWGAPLVAHAQSDEQRATARSLATEGSKAFNEGRFKDAVDMFQRAETLVHAPPHLLYLARSHAKLGQVVAAREAYLKILREQLPANAPSVFKDAKTAAEQEIRDVEPRIAKLTIQVQGAEGAGDLNVLLDGTPVESVLLGVARPIDPGAHTVEASATGFRANPQTVKLGDGESKSVLVAMSPAPGAAPPSATPAAETAPPAEATTASAPPTADQGVAKPGGTSTLRLASYVALGVGAVGLGAGTIFTLQSASKRSDADAKFEECGGAAGCRETDPLSAEVDSLDKDARSALTLGIVGFVVGGVGVAAGATLFVLSMNDTAQASTEPKVEAFVGLSSAGIRGRF